MTKQPEIEVTVLLPCLNEAETLESCVRKALRSLEECGVVGEVLVSDNGSTDGSQALAEAAGARVVHAPIRGYGGALLGGIEQARGRYVIMADADDSYALSDLGPFVEALRAGHDVVMGNRFRGGIAPGAMPPLHRYLGNPALSWLGRMLFGLSRVRDFHCGMRGFHAERIRALGLCMPGMEFASELVVRAALAGYDIVEVPTTLSPDGRSRPPHLRTWRDGWRHLRLLLVFAPGKTLVRPGAALALSGLVGAGALTPGPLSLGSVRLDVSTLAYACLMALVGMQLVLFGGLAEIYGRQERLVPQRASDRWIRLLRLETSAAVGLALLTLGVAGTVGAVSYWGLDGFGDLNPNDTLRVVLPSATAVALGVVVLFSGLVASLLTLRPAHPSPAIVRQPRPDDRDRALTGG
ncbi:glycosyltransferase family 2 protein [Micromonospora olivasterospora]|uniref:Glycosyl transferase family 2 n=1 Tax=Micromonospora olivasterospora TaxID=1880 RepID=A0A562IE08_MICOL|nr:glycosyltransferase family 2 protein [Micromonospora olivasterospora]TWH69241.1 glycosyl transferase family 2 [Micromonospora olivasterospora]